MVVVNRMADFAKNLRSLAAMIAAERAVQSETNDQLNAWIPIFLSALVPIGTKSIAPSTHRAASSRDAFNEDAVVSTALDAWRKRYKKSRKAGYSQEAEDRFAKEARETVRLVPDRSFQVAENVIQDGFRSGKSAEEILADIKTAVHDAKSTTAERTGGLIGPSAVNDATIASHADAQKYDGAGPYVKSWVNIFDGRTRPSHLEAGSDEDNIRIPLHQKFQVGGELADRPRDPSLPIEEIANCRCLAAIELA